MNGDSELVNAMLRHECGQQDLRIYSYEHVSTIQDKKRNHCAHHYNTDPSPLPSVNRIPLIDSPRIGAVR